MSSEIDGGPIKTGDLVRVMRAPDWPPGETISDSGAASRALFARAIGHVFAVISVGENGWLELEVGALVGEPAYAHSIYIEPGCVGRL